MNTLLTAFICSINPAILSFFFESEDSGALLAFILLLSGPLFFLIMYTRYRNVDKRHLHEKETPTQLSNLQASDNFVECRTRQSTSTIAGANSTHVEGSIVKGIAVKTLSLK